MTELQEILTAGGFELTDEQLCKLEQLRDFMTAYNRHTNLTRITEPRDVYVKHYLDSLSAWKITKKAYGGKVVKGQMSVADVGSGAGFPGLVIAVTDPTARVVLIDSTRKRTDYLAAAARELGIDVTVEWARAEELSKKPQYREKFDIVMSRAVAKLNLLAVWCLPFLRSGGLFAAMKGAEISDELTCAQAAFEKYRGKIECTELYKLPDEGERSVVLARKK